MRKISLILLFVGISFLVKGQVYIQTSLPTFGLVQKSQLWNLVLINGSAGSVDGKLTLQLRDRLSGNELFTATTGTISVPKGALAVNVNSLNPVQYNYLAMDGSGLMNGLLPSGSYVGCYTFVQSVSGKQDPLAEECVSFDIEPLSPPMLLFPSDSSVLDNPPTQFTWTPPTPAGMTSRLRYEVLITEINTGQLATQALQENISFYSTSGVQSNSLVYNGTLPVFGKEKWYGWQVIARDGNRYAGKSEVWVFKVKEPEKLSEMVEMTPFVQLKTDNPQQSIAPDGYLKIVYRSETSDSTARIEIIDLSGQQEGDKPPFIDIPVHPGDNFIQYNLKKLLGHPEEGKMYMAVLTNSRGEKWMIRFAIRYFGK